MDAATATNLLTAIADEGTVLTGSQALNIAQPAATKSIKELEDALGVQLFDRSSRQARLTEAGAELVREASRLLKEVDAVANRDANALARQLADERARTFRCGIDKPAAIGRTEGGPLAGV